MSEQKYRLAGIVIGMILTGCVSSSAAIEVDEAATSYVESLRANVVEFSPREGITCWAVKSNYETGISCLHN